MYLTRKKPLSHLKRLDRVFDGKPHAHSECWLKWPRLRKQYRKFIRDTMKFCTVVLGLATSLSTKLLQIRRDDQSRYHNLRPPSSLGSGWNEIHCPPANCCEITFKQVKNSNRNQESFTSVQMVHTHTPRSSGAFLEDASWSRMTVFSQEIQFEPRSAKHRTIMSDAFMCCHQQDHREFPGSLRGFEPKYLTKWPIEHSNWTKRHGPRSHHSGC